MQPSSARLEPAVAVPNCRAAWNVWAAPMAEHHPGRYFVASASKVAGAEGSERKPYVNQATTAPAGNVGAAEASTPEPWVGRGVGGDIGILAEPMYGPSMIALDGR